MQRRTSGPIRSALGPALKLLRQHLASAQVTMDSEISPENERELKNERKVLRGILNRVENQNHLWIEYINQLPADQMQAEQELYDAFPPRPAAPAEGAPPQPEYKTLVEWIEQGQYMLDMIEAALEENEDEQPAHVPIVENPRGPRRAETGATSHPRLPQIEVPKFGGEPAKWPQFWGLFENCIDSQPITGIEKMIYLLSRLEGNASKLVAGYLPTNKNYTTVVRILKERYGNERVISESLQRELMNLPRPNDSVHSLRTFVDSVERICRQLKDHKIEENNPFFATAIRERLPESMLTKLVEREMAERRIWKCDDLRQALQEAVGVMEEVNRFKKGGNEAHIERGTHSNNHGRVGPRLQGGTHRDRVMVATEAPRCTCSLCFGPHYPSDCDKYKTPQEKSARLKEQNRCINCLRNHDLRNCKSDRRCPCGGKHHKMVCFKGQGNARNNKYGPQNTNVPPNSNFSPYSPNFIPSNPNLVPINSKPVNNSGTAVLAPTLVGISKLVKDQADYVNENCDEERMEMHEISGKFSQFKGQMEKNETESLKFGNNELNLDTMKMDEEKCELEDKIGNYMELNKELPNEFDDGQLNELQKAEDLDGLVKQISALSYQNIQKLRKMDHAYYMTKKLSITSRRNPRHQLSAVVLCDGASGFNYITDQTVKRLHPPKISQENVEIHGVGGKMRAPIKIRSPTYAVMIKRMDGEWEELELNWIKDFSSPFLTVEWKIDGEIPKMDENELGEALHFAIEAPEIVISTRDMWRFIIGTKQVFHKVYAIMTVFGPMVAGESFVGPTCENLAPSLVAINAENVEQMPPVNSVQEFWSLETIGITENNPEEEEADAERNFMNSIRRQLDGRYVVKWPWRREKTELSSNFQQAYSRLGSLLRRCDLLEKIDDYYKDWIGRGIIEIGGFTNEEYFIPHHPIIGKKLRMVHDASSHDKGELSLNDCLHKGPNHLPKIASILLRSRSTEILLTADVEKAFTCVGLDDGERDFCKFLWLKDYKKPLTKENLLIYRFARVGFGITCAPYMLSGVIKVHLENHYPDLAKRFLENNYVDNLAMMCKSNDETMEMYKQSKGAFAGAQMNLREYTTNSAIAKKMIPKEDCIQDEIVKFLGIIWNTKSDTFLFEFPEVPASRTPTRRTVLSVMAGHYEPLGLTGPAILPAKILFQKLWGDKHDWDSPLVGDEKTNWMAILENWSGQKIEVPRFILCQNAEGMEIHAFVDASELSFATAVYICCGPPNQRHSSLVFSKNRLKPAKRSKSLTIHKLELFGILLGIRSIQFVGKEMELEGADVHLWSDSQVALSWLKTKEPQPAIIERRIKEIRTLENCKFHYVRTKENPADLATRGTTPEGLRESKIWWNGPNWLLNSDYWPKEMEFFLKYEPNEKFPKDLLDEAFVGTGKITGTIEMLIDPERFSSWSRLVKATIRLMKFILSVGEGRKWENPVFNKMSMQIGNEHSFPALKGYAEALIIFDSQNNDESLRKFNTFSDELGLLRLSTRIINSDCAYDQMAPIILPKFSRVTYLKLREIHVILCHAGVETTLTEFLGKFWSPQARKQTRQMVKKCPQCRRAHSAQFALPKMPPHPSRRTRASAPFLHIGVDYAGPSLTRLPEGNIVKVWLVLITCLMTRAVYIEPTLDMTTDSFLNVFRRFVARRGRPMTCLSDNGSQFVLANKTIELLTTGTNSNINWKFIPALSPWAGSVYERLIKIAKDCFKRSLGRLVLPYDELLSFTAEVEFSMNCRPITYCSDIQGEGKALRPIDFLHPKGVVGIETNSEDFFEDVKRSPQNRLAATWQFLTEMLDLFERRWQKEYLCILRDRSGWDHPGPHHQEKRGPKIGEVVLIRVDNYARIQWPIGKIISLEGGKTAQLKMPNGKILTRPISRLHPLETDIEDKRVEFNEESVEINPEDKNIEIDGNIELKKGEMNKKKKLGKKLENVAPQHKMITRSKTKLLATSIGLVNTIVLALLIMVMILVPINSSNITECRGCLAQCTENGVHLLIPRPFEKTEICCNELCLVRTHLDKVEFNLPTEILLNDYSCEIKFWKNKVLIPHEKSIKCEALDECQVLKCSWCLELILNPFCSPKMAIFVMGTLFLFFYFIICCFARTMKCCGTKLRHLYSAFIYILAVPVSFWKWLRWGKPIDTNAAKQTVKQKIRNVKKGVAKTSLNWRQRSLKAAGLLIVLCMVFGASNAESLGKVNNEMNENMRNENHSKSETLSKYDLALILVLGFALIYLGWIFTIFEERMIEEMERERRELVYIERMRRRIRRENRGVHWTMVLIIFMAVPSSWAFSNVVSISSQSRNCRQNEEKITCVVESSTTLTILPAGQTNTLLINDSNNGTLGMLNIVLHRLAKLCKARTLAWTRDYEIKTEFTKRCPGAGSCGWKECSDIESGTILDEMEHNSHPGHTFCQNVPSTAADWCPLGVPLVQMLTGSKACLFYRWYAENLSTETFRIVDCPDWEYIIKAEIKLEMSENGKMKELNHQVVLREGQTTQLGKITLTPLSITESPSPMISNKFIIGERNIAIVPDYLRWNDLKCENEIAASAFDCSLSIEACSSCQVGENVKCNCRVPELFNIMENVDYKLPLTIMNNRIFEDEKGILMERDYSAIELNVKLENMELSSNIMEEKCLVKIHSLQGCYQCQSGAELKLECKTMGEKTIMAQAICGEKFRLAIHCSPNGTQNDISIASMEPEIDQECTLNCPGGKEEFRLKAKLYFIPLKLFPEGRVRVKKELDNNENWMPNFSLENLPDFNFDPLNFAQFFSIFKSALLIVLFITIGLVLLSLFCKLIPVKRVYGLLWRTLMLAYGLGMEMEGNANQRGGTGPFGSQMDSLCCFRINGENPANPSFHSFGRFHFNPFFIDQFAHTFPSVQYFHIFSSEVFCSFKMSNEELDWDEDEMECSKADGDLVHGPKVPPGFDLNMENENLPKDRRNVNRELELPQSLPLPKFGLDMWKEKHERMKQRVERKLQNKWEGFEHWELIGKDWKEHMIKTRARDSTLNRLEIFHSASETVAIWKSEKVESEKTDRRLQRYPNKEDRLKHIHYRLITIAGERIMKHALRDVIRSMEGQDQVENIPPEGLQLPVEELPPTPGIISNRRAAPPKEWVNPQDVEEKEEIKAGMKDPYNRYWSYRGVEREKKRIINILDDDENRRKKRDHSEDDEGKGGAKKMKVNNGGNEGPASPEPEEYEPVSMRILVDCEMEKEIGKEKETQKWVEEMDLENQDSVASDMSVKEREKAIVEIEKSKNTSSGENCPSEKGENPISSSHLKVEEKCLSMKKETQIASGPLKLEGEIALVPSGQVKDEEKSEMALQLQMKPNEIVPSNFGENVAGNMKNEPLVVKGENELALQLHLPNVTVKSNGENLVENMKNELSDVKGENLECENLAVLKYLKAKRQSIENELIGIYRQKKELEKKLKDVDGEIEEISKK